MRERETPVQGTQEPNKEKATTHLGMGQDLLYTIFEGIHMHLRAILGFTRVPRF